MTRIAVSGAAGFLGWNLCRVLAKRHEVTGLVHCASAVDLPLLCVPVELEQPNTFDRAFQDFRPDVFVHAAAYCNVEHCEAHPELAFAINAAATRALVDLCNSRAITFVYISTDLVFDGIQGHYREDQPADPISVYGRSKRAAELAVLQSTRRGAVLRCALMYGPTNGVNRCFLTWIEQRLAAGEPVPLYRDQFRSALFVEDVAAAVEGLVDRPFQSELFHVGGPERIDRYSFGLLAAEALRYDKAALQSVSIADSSIAGRRGADCSMRIDKLREFAGWNPASPVEGLKRVRQWRQSNPRTTEPRTK
ncbi:MAG: SDR family oxidoreductase [Acidobacteriota bacterium]